MLTPQTPPNANGYAVQQARMFKTQPYAGYDAVRSKPQSAC